MKTDFEVARATAAEKLQGKRQRENTSAGPNLRGKPFWIELASLKIGKRRGGVQGWGQKTARQQIEEVPPRGLTSAGNHADTQTELPGTAHAIGRNTKTPSGTIGY